MREVVGFVLARLEAHKVFLDHHAQLHTGLALYARKRYDVFRSLLILGTTAGVDHGIARDDRVHSTSEFPFPAAP